MPAFASSLSLCVLLILAVAPAAPCATLRPFNPSRSITTSLCATYTCFNTYLYQDGVTESSAVPGALRASQTTSLGPVSISGTGSVDLSVGYPFKGEATSRYSMAFDLSEAATVIMLADLTYSLRSNTAPTSTAYLTASLCGWGPHGCFDYVREVVRGGAGLPLSDSGHIAFGALLGAGRYSLHIQATGRQEHAEADFGALDWGFVVAVPEPESLGPLTLAYLAVGFAAAFRSTPR